MPTRNCIPPPSSKRAVTRAKKLVITKSIVPTDIMIKNSNIIEYNPKLPIFADVNRWHPLLDIRQYALNCPSGILGMKICEHGRQAVGAMQQLQIAENAGLMVIGYCYGTDVSNFLNYFPPKPGRLPCVDYEGNNISVESATADIQTLYTQWKRYPAFYAGNAWRVSGQPDNTILRNCPFWGCQYGPHLRVPNGVGKPFAWQFSDGVSGPGPKKYPGIGMCDISSLLVSQTELKSIMGVV